MKLAGRGNYCRKRPDRQGRPGVGLELYVFEAYAALSLRTHEWNTFRTH